MKKCSTCKALKSPSQFHVCRKNKDGKQSKCKVCRKEASLKYSRTESGRASQEKRKNHPQYKEYQKNYTKSDDSKYNEKFRQRARRAIKKGLIIKTDCESCGNPNTEAHHDDYNKPLVVRFLCCSCHTTWHQFNKPIQEKKSLKEVLRNIFN